MLKRLFQDLLYRISQPLVGLLVRFRVSPDLISLAGLLLNVWAACLFVYGGLQGFEGLYIPVFWGGVILLAGGFLDILDGRVARLRGVESPAGSLLDSVLDRYAEGFMFLGIGGMAWALDQTWVVLLAFSGMLFSFMVSYTRAKTESLQLQEVGGWFQRPERIVLIVIFCLVSGLCGHYHIWPESQKAWSLIFVPGMVVLNIGAATTALQRLYSGYRKLKQAS